MEVLETKKDDSIGTSLYLVVDTDKGQLNLVLLPVGLYRSEMFDNVGSRLDDLLDSFSIQ